MKTTLQNSWKLDFAMVSIRNYIFGRFATGFATGFAAGFAIGLPLVCHWRESSHVGHLPHYLIWPTRSSILTPSHSECLAGVLCASLWPSSWVFPRNCRFYSPRGELCSEPAEGIVGCDLCCMCSSLATAGAHGPKYDSHQTYFKDLFCWAVHVTRLFKSF